MERGENLVWERKTRMIAVLMLSFAVIDWLMEHRTADSIEEVTEEMLVMVSHTLATL